MVSYHTFATTRSTRPDPAALLAALRAIVPTAGVTELSPEHYRVKTPDLLVPNQITAMQAAIDTAPALTPQRAAQNEIDRWPIAQRALVLALIDELNTIRAALPTPLGPRTPAQALAAVRAKAGTLA